MEKLFRLNGFKVFVLVLDILVIAACWTVSGKLIHPDIFDARFQDMFILVEPWMILLYIISLFFFSLYDFSGRQNVSQLVFQIISVHLLFGIGIMIWNRLLTAIYISEKMWLTTLATALLLTFGLRLLLYSMQTSALVRKRLLVAVNDRNLYYDKIAKILSRGQRWFSIQRIYSVSDNRGKLPESAWEEVDALLIGPDIGPEARVELLVAADKNKVEVLLYPQVYELSLFHAEVQQIDDVMIYSMTPSRLTMWERAIKRTIDILFSSAMLIVASPIMLFMYIAIPLNSSGKALFVQKRVGLEGKPFNLFKFRSMINNAEKDTGPVLAQDDDTRITRLGRFIRAIRLDELPQLINVLLGHMSLVGPRPEREFFITQFEAEMPHYTCRLLVKPGLTGLAQVKANYTTSPEDKLCFDLAYIKNYSIFLDLNIMFQTLIVILRREQSRGISSIGQDESGLAQRHLIVPNEVAAHDR